MATSETRPADALASARAYFRNVAAVGNESDPDALLQLAIAGGAGRIQSQHAEMARTAALVSIAESLARLVELHEPPE